MTATVICEATLRDAETATATATTLEVLAFLLFYISFDLFLEISSDYPNLLLDVVFGCAHIYWNLIQLLGFRKISSFPFNFFPCLQRIENEGSIGFSPVLLRNSDQLYFPTFSLSLFISYNIAPGFAPPLEVVFSSKASIFGFCSMFCSTAGVALSSTMI